MEKITRSIYAEESIWERVEVLAEKQDRTSNWIAVRAVEEGLKVLEKRQKVNDGLDLLSTERRKR